MANWISYIKDDLGSGATTRDGMIADGPTHGVQLSTDLPPLTGITTCATIEATTINISGNLKLDGQLKDGDDDFGSSGQVLSSDGTDTKWVNAGSLSAGAASLVAINDDGNTNAARFLTFVDSSSGNNSVKTDTQLTYNPSTNVISTSGIDVSDNSKIRFGNGNDLHISHTNDLSGQNDSNGDSVLDGDNWCSYIKETGTGPLIFKSNGGPSTGAYHFYDTAWRPILKLFSGTSARAALYHAGSEKLITSSTGITVTGTAAATAFSGPLTGNVTGNVSGNAGTATVLQTARNIGGVSFNGSAAINLPGVNQSGNQNTSGNAATATVLETTRAFSISGEITANAVNFNGSGNVALSATIDNNIVDEANLKISNGGSDGQFLCKRSGNTGGMTWETVSNSASALSGGTLASGITNSSLTGLGTLASLTVSGQTDLNGHVNIGNATNDTVTITSAIDSDVTPDSTSNNRSLGNSVQKWKTAYIETVNASTVVANLTGNISGNASGNAATATKLATVRSIGGVNFDGSGSINLPGVNATGNQNTSGSSASCTGNAATASEVYQTVNDSTNNYAVLFSDENVNNSSGNKGVQHDSNTFWYNPGMNTLTVQYLNCPNWNQLPAGTRMLFQQTNAPTGWTKDTSDTNQRALRVVSGSVGSGGNTDFTSAFRNWTTNSHTLTTAQIPSHRHWVSGMSHDDGNCTGSTGNGQDFGLAADAGSYSSSDQNKSNGRYIAYAGGGGSHNHGTMNFAVRYLDVIIASKN